MGRDKSTVSALLPHGWHVDDNDDLICRCGYVIELDGTCPDGCVSPLLAQGMI